MTNIMESLALTNPRDKQALSDFLDQIRKFVHLNKLDEKGISVI